MDQESRFNLLPILCSDVVMISWSFHSTMTRKITNQDNFQIHIWKYQAGMYSSLCCMPQMMYGDILSTWVGGGRGLQTPRDLTNTHKDGRSNTDVG